MNENDLAGFEKYLNDLVGFFIVEAHVVANTDNFRSRASIDLLWEAASDKLKEVITVSLQNCENPDHFLRIKELMINFIETLENYNFAVNKLLTLLMAFFERYTNLKMLSSSEKCDKNIEMDDGSCVTVHSIAEYQDMLKIYNYTVGASSSAKSVFPKSFPFSQSFLGSCKEIKAFIQGFYQFAEGFHQQFNEMDDILKKAVEVLITQHICSSLEGKLMSGTIKLSEVVRTILDLEHYQLYIAEIETIIHQKRASQRLVAPKNASANKLGVEEGAKATMTENCQKKLHDTRAKAGNRIYELVNKKIDDFLDLAEYDFCPMDPHRSGSPTKEFPTNPKKDPSPYLSDLVDYLDVVWSSILSDLPVTVKSFVYYEAIYHLVLRLLGMITHSNVKKLSPLFVDCQFNTDVSFLESFVGRLGDPNLIEHVVEIRQTVNFIKSDSNPEEYLQPNMKNKKYLRVSKANALCLLEKVRDSGFWNDGSSLMNALGIASASPKDFRAVKRKQIETTIKSLREEKK